MNNTGYIKLDRKMVNWEHYKDGNVIRVFLDLLLAARSIATKKNGQTVEAGTVLTTISEIKERTGLKSKHTIIDALITLEQSGEITRERLGNKTIVKINQYLIYQGGAKNAPPEVQKMHRRGAKNAPPYLLYEDNKLSSIKEQLKNTPLCAREEKNEIQNPQKIGFEKFGSDGLVELKPVEHRTLVETFGEETVKAAIEDLNDKIAAGGNDDLNNAKSHFHVLRYWLRYRKDTNLTKPQIRKVDLNALK